MVEFINDGDGAPFGEIVHSPIFENGQKLCDDWYFLRTYTNSQLQRACGTYYEVRQRVANELAGR